MKLTRIEASTLQEALWKIRSTLGEDAMIVGTRTFRRGGVLGWGGRERVEVYVADSPGAEGPRQPEPLGRQEAVIRQADEPALSGGPETISRALGSLREEIRTLAARHRSDPFDHPFLKEAFQVLLAADIEPKLAEQVVWELKSVRLPAAWSDPGRVRALLKAQLRKLFLPNVPTGFPADNKVLVLLGPTGVGKTTTVAKLAARGKINERKQIALVTLDTFRIAAVEQLQKYSNIIGVSLEVASDPVEFAGLVKRFQENGNDLILVDTAGRGQRDEIKLRELEEFLSVVPQAEVHLVLSATSHPRTLKSVAGRFSPLGFHRLVLTKIDETESFGSLVSALVDIGKPVSFLTDGQNVPDDILISDPDRLAELVFRACPS